MTIITFQSKNCHSSPSMIKSFLKMCFWSVNLSIVSCHYSSTNGWLFDLIFKTMNNIHNYETTLSATCKIFKPYMIIRTNLYGKNSITINAFDTCIRGQISLGDTILKDLTPNKINTIMKRMTDNNYSNTFVVNGKSVFL